MKRLHSAKPPLLVLGLLTLLMSSSLFAVSAARKAKDEEKAFLETNRQKEGIITTRSGLQYEILSKGDSDQNPRSRDTIQLHYHGTFTDGVIFDSSLLRGDPLEIKLFDVIPGWTEGLKLMSPGDKYRFYIPSKLAYGSSDTGIIPAYSTLVFDIELLALLDKKRSSRK